MSDVRNDAKRREEAADTPRERARAIVASFGAGEPTSDEVFDAFWQLDTLPVSDVRDALTSLLGPLPDVDRLDAATRRAHGLPPPPLRLRASSVAKDADVLDLGPIAEEQLRIAGTTWDGEDRAAEERLDGEIDGSFAGTLERLVLSDADAPTDTPLFDVLLFAEDAGVVFAAGTSRSVALIAYGKVEMRDRRTRVAIEEALAAARALAAVEEEPVARGPVREEPVDNAPVEKAPVQVELFAEAREQRVAKVLAHEGPLETTPGSGERLADAPSKKATEATKTSRAKPPKKTTAAKKAVSSKKATSAKKATPAKKATILRKAVTTKTAPRAKTPKKATTAKKAKKAR